MNTNICEYLCGIKFTHKLHTSTSGPYCLPGMNSSGAAYSGLPQCVCKRAPGF